MSFISTFNRGFHLSFANNLTISVQWGTSNYCERKKSVYLSDELRDVKVESKDAEIAIWENSNGKRWFNFGADEVKGYCTSDEVAQWIYKVSMASSLDSLQNETIENNFNKLFGGVKN